jgi:hypothetical protein
MENKVSDTNYPGNKETRDAIQRAKETDLGPQVDKAVGLANATAALNTAESLQMLQIVIENQTNKLTSSIEGLAASNDKYANRMIGLTLALVFVGAVSAIAALASSYPYLRYLINTFL